MRLHHETIPSDIGQTARAIGCTILAVMALAAITAAAIWINTH